MSKLIIRGPVQLNGLVSVRGGKNAALPIIIAAGITGHPVKLSNVPTELKDIDLAFQSLKCLGAGVESTDGNVTIDGSTITNTELPPEIAGRFRYSLLFLGLLVGRFGHARVTFPGGCDLGDRKFDLHLEGLRKLGADVKIIGDSIEVQADKLVGTDIDFYLPTTSGTETVILAACFAKGRTRIFNANTRPEIVDMGNFLNSLGAKVSVKNRVVEVEGISDFTGTEYNIMPGWDEALTYMIAAGITGGEICVENFTLDYVQSDVNYLRQAGLDVFQWGGNVYVSAKARKLAPFDLFTAPYPGVNSDMQPIFAALASQCYGESTITDQRFTERFQYVSEFQKLGMDIDSYGNCAVVRGPSKLKGAKVTATDLRCGAALVISALTAKGTTQIDNCYQLYRGYENVVQRFKGLGADITAEDDD